jgi:hypothetical protein
MEQKIGPGKATGDARICSRAAIAKSVAFNQQQRLL